MLLAITRRTEDWDEDWDDDAERVVAPESDASPGHDPARRGLSDAAGDQTVTLIYPDSGCALRRPWARWEMDGISSIPETENRDPGSSSMSTQMKDGRRIADARDDQNPHPVHAAVGTTPEQARVAADTSIQRAQDSMAQLVRQGQDTSLRSLQVWADLARKLGPTALSFPAGAATVALACGPFEKLLEAQRQVVDELVATQRQLVKQLFDITAIVGGNPIT